MDSELLKRMRALVESGEGMSISGQRRLLEEYDRATRALSDIAEEAGKVWNARADAVDEGLIHRLAISVLPNASDETAGRTEPRQNS